MKKLLPIFIITFIFQFSQAQTIKVYFNQTVDNSVSSLTDARTSAHLDDTIKKMIDAANATIDIAVWDNGSSMIVDALNAAHLRGVQVRYITSSNSINSALSGLNAAIPILERNSTISRNVMHNKFIVADGEQLLMGSMNFGNGSIHDDYNNIVLINDNNLANAYTTEFNEMWGSNGAQPNLANSKFGVDKTDNTTHNFTIGSSSIQSYFSPTDNTTAQIVNAINSADYTLDIAMFTFINNDIGDAVIAAKQRGVYVRCIVENVSYFGSEYNGIVAAGISAFSHESVQYDFHHKYCIIDAFLSSSDPQVVTGSHNWTNSAEEEYDENTLIIHDISVAQQYSEEFFHRWTDLGGAGLTENTMHELIQVFPNPSNGNFTFYLASLDFDEIEICDLLGQPIFSFNSNTLNSTIHFKATNGVYIIRAKKSNQVLASGRITYLNE